MKILNIKLFVAGITLCFTSAAVFAVTPFEMDVTQSIDDGLNYLDRSGAFNNPSSARDAVGLTTLALLEKRASGDPNDPPQGYSGASAADQARLRQSIRYILDQINNQGNGFYSYRDGGYMMALSVYMRTGGSDKDDGPTTELDGAPLTLVEAYNIVVDRTIANQRQGISDSAAPWPENNGYWCYRNSGCRDSSTTQLVVAGLSAALALYSDPGFSDPARFTTVKTATALARKAYQRNGIPGGSNVVCGVLPNEKGHGYNAGSPNSIQQTASGTWIQLVGGADLNDSDVQAYLRWIQHRYRHTQNSQANANISASHWYYLWSFSKATEFILASGIVPSPGNIAPADIGTLLAIDAPACNIRESHRDPSVDTRAARFGAGGAGYYNEEAQRVYYDFAHNILEWQCGNAGETTGNAGQYRCNSAPRVWNNYSAQAYALLVLQRSVGGGCVDSDGDGVCDDVDNCRLTANPNQQDTDNDGLGNACDNCPDIPNPDQADDDNDGVGNACEVQQDPICDVDGDGDIDRSDLRLISRARNQVAQPGDPRDADGDGIITFKDVKACIAIMP